MPNVQQRVTHQFPSLFVTLVSVLIGLAFADLVSEAHARMTLWPLTLETAFTWAQLTAVMTSAIASWIVYSHIGISRHALATVSDTIVAFLIPVPLLLMTAMTGRVESWPWFYGGSAYLVMAITAGIWQVRLAMREPELKSFGVLLRPTGFLFLLYTGAPAYLLLGWLDQHALMPLEAKLAAAIAPTPMALVCAWMFVRDWRTAVASAPPVAET